MTAYNILKPITRSLFISQLGADNLPWVQLAAGILIGFIMQGYSRVDGAGAARAGSSPSRRPASSGCCSCSGCCSRPSKPWVAVGFYFFGLILGILLISQFWTLANDIYDPRQAKRLFGFIGGGASLGGIAGAAILDRRRGRSAPPTCCWSARPPVVLHRRSWSSILRRDARRPQGTTETGEEKGVSGSEAIRLLRSRSTCRSSRMVIGFAAIGAAIIEQQLNMAAEASRAPATPTRSRRSSRRSALPVAHRLRHPDLR